MTHILPKTPNYPYEKKDQSIYTSYTSGIAGWNILENSKQQSEANLSEIHGLIKAEQKNSLRNEYININNRVLKLTKKCLIQHSNFAATYSPHDDIQGTIEFSTSQSGSLFIDSEVNPKIEHLLHVVRSDKISDLQEIISLFHLYNRIETINYLLENSSLITTLLDAYNQVKKVFTNNEKLSLKLCLDPEESNWEKILLSIHVGYDADVDQVYSLKEYLDDNWWLDVYSSVPNLDINISFDEF